MRLLGSTICSRGGACCIASSHECSQGTEFNRKLTSPRYVLLSRCWLFILMINPQLTEKFGLAKVKDTLKDVVNSCYATFGLVLCSSADVSKLHLMSVLV